MMTKLAAALPADMPARIAKLPRDHRGFPVPWFVAYFDEERGERCEPYPDFRVIDTPKIGRAVRERRCWVCGEPLGIHKAFVIGPMCAINRVISEPPSHRECAEYAARACPFLARPRMRRNETDLPGPVEQAAGFVLKRNPGAVAVWITRTFKPFRPHAGNAGVLFQIGAPETVLWFAHGRAATRAEVLASIDSGYPSLLELAQAEGGEAVAALERQRLAVMPLLPPQEVVAISISVDGR